MDSKVQQKEQSNGENAYLAAGVSPDLHLHDSGALWSIEKHLVKEMISCC
jgi:hypothetical protein